MYYLLLLKSTQPNTKELSLPCVNAVKETKKDAEK
jgi:hypothetical protein